MLYLAYGSNLFPPRLAARCPSAEPLGAVALSGWRLAFHKRGRDGSGKCDLVSAEGSIAYGALYRLSERDKPVLDRIEGVGFGYEEHGIELPSWGRAYLYVAQSSHVRPRLRPFDWYHRFVIEGARHHGFPEPYVRGIEAVPVLRDADPVRIAGAASVLCSSVRRTGLSSR